MSRLWAKPLPAAICELSLLPVGWLRSEQFRGKDSLLSGPAGGAVGFSRVGQAAGFARTIGFDMGGTSTDVSRFDGRHELDYETEQSGVSHHRADVGDRNRGGRRRFALRVSTA